MNNILYELDTIETGWDYSDLAELASSHGNPEQLIIDIYSDGYIDGAIDNYLDGYDDGYQDGGNNVIAYLLKVGIPLAVIAISGAVAWGITTWRNHKKTKAELLALAEENAKLKAQNYVDGLVSVQTVNIIAPEEEEAHEDECDNNKPLDL